MIDEGALPLLENFVIGRSPQLKEVPCGILHLRNLKELRFIDMHKEFEESLDPKLGSHYWIIEHVPIVYLLHKVNNQVQLSNANSNQLGWKVNITTATGHVWLIFSRESSSNSQGFAFTCW
nr:putative disease resistance rpp8-like protein 4 [Quercus suber]